MLRLSRSQTAFTLIELLIVIGIIGLLIGIILPSLEKVRHKGYVVACASNLRQLGQGLSMYSTDNHGSYPRTIYDPTKRIVAGTGASAIDPFVAGGPQANDVTAAVWLLLRTERLPTLLVICPYNDVNEFVADAAVPEQQANFTNYSKTLGYSYANPYPDQQAATKGYRVSNKLPAAFAVMADLNPGVSTSRTADVFAPKIGAGASVMKLGNSENHEREGQNVLYGDGHVSYEQSPVVGMGGDNIYTSQSALSPNVMASPATNDDSVLLPVD